jgi:hypothetical protein
MEAGNHSKNRTGICMRLFSRAALTVATALFALNAFAGDILTLTNEMVFDGKITRIKDCTVVFRASDGNRYTVPADDIFSIQFEDVNDRVYTNYMQDMNSDNCMKGTQDAAHHGKTVGHLVLGILFGPWAVLGTAAIAKPTPMKSPNNYMMTANQSLFSDPQYLHCYKKQAKLNLMTWEMPGMILWLLVIAL